VRQVGYYKESEVVTRLKTNVNDINAYPAVMCNVYRVFSGGKERPGRDTDPSSPSSAVVMKE